MDTLIGTIHIIACAVVVVLVLLQSGKEGMGVIFGGGSGSVFGSTGAGGLLVKLTALFGALFLITSLVYNAMIGRGSKGGPSVMEGAVIEQKAAPAENKMPGQNLFEEPKVPEQKK